MTLSTGNTLSLTSEGPLNIQGNNVDISTDGNGFVTARDVTVDSATYTEFQADADILLNSTYHSSFITQNGDIELLVEDTTTFDANFLNVDASFGVDINSEGETNIQAFAILEMQAAQFAQVRAYTNINVNVLNGDFDINAAATAAIASENDLEFNAANNFEIYSLGDSESIVQFNARSGLTTFAATNSLTIGTFVDSYDVDLIASGSIASFSGFTDFVADNEISTVAGQDLSIIASGPVAINSLDLEASSYGNSNIQSLTGSVTFDTLENFKAQAKDVVIATTDDVQITSREVSFIQGAPAILSRSEPNNLSILTNSITTNSVTTQFETIGDFILSTPQLVVSAGTVDIRSSGGPHNVVFNVGGNFDVDAQDDIKYLASTINIEPRTVYTTLSDSLNFVSEDSLRNIFTSGSDTYINSPTSTFSSDGDTTIEAEFDEVNIILSDNFIQNSYNNYLQTLGDIDLTSGHTIAVGANEYINFESVFDSNFNSQSIFVRGDQTGSMFAEDITTLAPITNFLTGDTLYLTANLPTDSLDINADNITFVGTTVLESGRNLEITATVDSIFTGSKLVIDGYDYNNFNTPAFNVDANAHVSLSSDGAFDASTTTLSFSENNVLYSGPQSDSHMYLTVNNDINFSGGNYQFYADYDLSYTDTTATFLGSFVFFYMNGDISYESENTIQLNVGGSFYASCNTAVFESLVNDFHTTNNGFDISAGNTDITAGLDNVFSSTGSFGLNSYDAWFVGGKLALDGDTLNFFASNQGYFYSDDQITFNVQNGINIQSNTLNFILPLDGSLFLEGVTATIQSTSAAPFIFLSNGATTVAAEGVINYDASGYTVYDSVTTHIGASDLSLTGTLLGSSATIFAHEGEVNFEGTNYGLVGSTNSFLASRDVNIKGNAFFLSGASDPATIIRDNSVLNVNTTDSLAILAETIHEDGHIVFHALSGDILTNAGDEIYINTEGLQSITGAYGFSSYSLLDTDFVVTGNHNLQTATGTTFDAGRTWSLSVVGQTYIESGLDILLQNILVTDPAAPFTVFSIIADTMTVSTSQEGPLHITSDSDIQFLTDTFQSWEVTHATLTQSGTSTYTSTVGDITTLTSSGKILSDFATFAGSAGVNITFNSGHDSTFTAGATTYSAGTDVLTRSLDGKIVFTNGAAANFIAGGQISIDSEGPRTVPRDGVFFGGNNINMQTTGANSAIYLYARRSVTFGEFTRPDVSFTAGGSPTQNGWVLTSDGKISLDAGTQANFASAAQFTLTTSQAAIYTSGAAMNLESTGTLTGSADNIQISSLIGNIHFHSKLDSTWTTPSQFSATSTSGYISFTTLGSATFEADGNFKESANSLTYSFDLSYTSTSSSTSFDGHTYFDITTQLGSDGSIVFNSGNAVFSSTGNFDINTYGDDAKLQLSAVADLTIRTPKTGSISFNSYDGLDLVATDIIEFADEQYTVTANSNIGDNPSKGSIEYYTLGSFSITAEDSIDYTSSMDVSIIGGTLDVSSTGDFLANSDWDQEWIIGSTATQNFNSLFDVIGGIYFENSPSGGGDINFFTSGLNDITYFHSTNGDVLENIGNNQIGRVDEGFRILTSGSDFKDAFGIRFQTEGPANLQVFASASAVFNGHKNIKFDASEDLNVFGGIGLSMVAQGVNLDNDGIIFVASNGDVKFNTAQSPISFVGNHIDVVGNGTSANQGIIKLTANGIDKDSQYGIRMQFDAAVAAFGSIEADINVSAKESIEIGLNFQGAHALFGYQRNAAEALANLFPYDPFYPYIPSNHINVPLQSETRVIATGIGADIVIDTQKTEDGVGQFIAYAGTIEEAYASQTNAPSQLQLIAYGNGDVMGDITFQQQGGISFRGVDLTRAINNYVPDRNTALSSNILFLANDETSDVVVKTTQEALFSDINHITSELTVNAENKLQIRSIGRNGDSNVQFDSERKIYVQTTGPSQGPGTELPGIELRAFRSMIEIDAGDFGDVVHHALRNMYLEADNGFQFNSRGTMAFTTDNIFFRSSAGGITFRHSSSVFNTNNNVVISTYSDATGNPDYINYLGDSIEFKSDNIQFFTNFAEIQAIGGDITFNFEDSATIQASNTINVFGYMSIPMTDELIVNGQPCEGPSSSSVQRVVIARSPPYDAYNIFRNNNGPYADPQYGFYNADIYQGLGLRLCTCGAIRTGGYTWSCMNFSQFNL